MANVQQTGAVPDENTNTQTSEQPGKAVGLNTRSRKPLSNLGTNVQQQGSQQAQAGLQKPQHGKNVGETSSEGEKATAHSAGNAAPASGPGAEPRAYARQSVRSSSSSRGVKPSNWSDVIRGNNKLGGARSLSQLIERTSDQAGDSALPDIDVPDKNNPLACAEYVNQIYNYWFRVEHATHIEPTYMQEVQADINDRMRAILIDWLVEVHLKFKLMPETLFLTINLIDRFLSVRAVSRKNLQLVGVTAMLLASKYEEIWAPEVRDFVYISDKAYTRNQILVMERDMLNTLSFKLSVPTPYQFMCRFIKANGAEKQQALLVSFLVELSLPEYHMLRYPPSQLAAGAICASNEILGKQPQWNHTLMMHTRYTKEQVLQVAQEMAKLMRKASSESLVAVHKKYSHSRFLEVARLHVPDSLIPE